MPVHDSAQILAIKLAAYNKNVEDIRQWYKSEHMNYQLIDGERSKWWVWNTVLEKSRDSVRQIQTYLQRIADGNCTKFYYFRCYTCILVPWKFESNNYKGTWCKFCYTE